MSILPQVAATWPILNNSRGPRRGAKPSQATSQQTASNEFLDALPLTHHLQVIDMLQYGQYQKPSHKQKLKLRIKPWHIQSHIYDEVTSVSLKLKNFGACVRPLRGPSAQAQSPGNRLRANPKSRQQTTEGGGWGEREEVPRARHREGHSTPRGPHRRWQCARGGGTGDSLREHGRLRKKARQTSGRHTRR